MARVHKPARRLRADPRKGREKKRSTKADHEETIVIRKPASIAGVESAVDFRIPDGVRSDMGPKDDPEELDEHEA